MYKNSTVLDKKIRTALNKKSFISAIIVLCAGFLTIIASVFMFIDKDKYYGIIYLVCSSYIESIILAAELRSPIVL